MDFRSRASLVGCIARDERGATAIEYGLILGLITLASLAALTQLAGTVVDKWNYVAGAVTNAS